MTITGTVAQINALLNTDGTSTVSYIDNTDTPAASATLTLSMQRQRQYRHGGDADRQRHGDHQHHGGERRAGGDDHAGELQRDRADGLNLKNNGLSVSDVDAGSGSRR